MAKRRRSGGRDVSLVTEPWMKHLYLAFDDWSWGYSIRKVDLTDSGDSWHTGGRPLFSTDEEEGAGGIPRVPPVVIRLEAPHGSPKYFASAFGARILAMHPRIQSDWQHMMPESFFPIYDVGRRGLFWGPRPTANPVDPIYIAAHGMFFALDTGPCLEGLFWPPMEQLGGHNVVWTWFKLQDPPFERQEVISYGAHPDGQILFSTVTNNGGTAATYALNTKYPFSWSLLGNWRLPFAGCGHFDVRRRAFVGLSGDPDTLGHLYSCSAIGSDVKLSKKRLFSVNGDSTEVHLGATLLYLGRKFCLVHCIGLDDDDDGSNNNDGIEERAAPRRIHLYRLTTLSVKYGRNNGALKTGRSRRVQYCRVPESASEPVLKNPVAFWL
ncbi:hypothetical protein QOZ80_3BG0263410 [Eleusine coracana subsp. coracana]|nr:hypothetical protein QOZ80_3BG0263410 [Eleusine coracana subsp. coracana]